MTTPDPGNDTPTSLIAEELHKLARYAWQAVLVTGIVAIVLGVLVLMWPGISIIVAGVLFGLYLVVGGVMQLVAAFGTHGTTALRVLAFVSGALSILLGLLCFRSAFDSILLLALWIGIGWLFRGIIGIVSAISDANLPARGWQGFYGVISLLAGIALIDSPLSSVALLTLLGGIWLIALGVVEIITAFRVRTHAKRVV
ncbi:MAG TPA: HdeD family acid-resistance protein [Pseudonocardiaceae bacterium]|nr:HdeD family acid-resistance protein [Pseudonocardiaceae bacterium]